MEARRPMEEQQKAQGKPVRDQYHLETCLQLGDMDSGAYPSGQSRESWCHPSTKNDEVTRENREPQQDFKVDRQELNRRMGP